MANQRTQHILLQLIKVNEEKKKITSVLDIPTAVVACQHVCPNPATPSIHLSILTSGTIEDSYN